MNILENRAPEYISFSTQFDGQMSLVFLKLLQHYNYLLEIFRILVIISRFHTFLKLSFDKNFHEHKKIH